MIAWTSPYIWYTSRATGVAALVLLTLVIGLGVLISTRVGGKRVGRFEINELHRALSLVAMIFVSIHVVSTVIDTYVPIGWISAFGPFTSSYKRVPVAIGTIAFDLMLAVWGSSQLKDRLDPKSWRAVHYLSYGSFVAAAIHSYMVGTDAHARWALVTLFGCVGFVLVATVWRVYARPQRAAGRTALSPLQSPAAASPSVPPRTPPSRFANRPAARNRR